VKITDFGVASAPRPMRAAALSCTGAAFRLGIDRDARRWATPMGSQEFGEAA
jgi:hypothetical protein